MRIAFATMSTVTRYSWFAAKIISSNLFIMLSIFASVNAGGRPCVFRSLCLTRSRVKVDLSRCNSVAILFGAMPSLWYHISAKRISSEDIFVQTCCFEFDMATGGCDEGFYRNSSRVRKRRLIHVSRSWAKMATECCRTE